MREVEFNDEFEYKEMKRYKNLPDEEVPDDAENANIVLDNIDYLKYYIDNFLITKKQFEDIIYNNLIDYQNVQNATETTATLIRNGFNVKGKWYVGIPLASESGTYQCSYEFELIGENSVGYSGLWRLEYNDGTYSSFLSSGEKITTTKDIKTVLFYISSGSVICEGNFTKILLLKS